MEKQTDSLFKFGDYLSKQREAVSEDELLIAVLQACFEGEAAAKRVLSLYRGCLGLSVEDVAQQLTMTRFAFSVIISFSSYSLSTHVLFTTLSLSASTAHSLPHYLLFVRV